MEACNSLTKLPFSAEELCLTTGKEFIILCRDTR
jgi:hypothetical protein